MEIQKVFEEFDKDHNCEIDEDELKMLIIEMGFEISDEEANQCMQDIDKNNNGTISPAEFQHWWLAGRPGKTGLIARSLRMFNTAAEMF